MAEARIQHLSGLLALSERRGRASQTEIHTLRRGESALPLLFASPWHAAVDKPACSVSSVCSQVPRREEDLISKRSREFGVVG